MSEVRTVAPAAMLLALLSLAGPANAQTCPAIPDDGIEDDAVIQACLNGGGLVSLASGVYNIRLGLRLRVSGTVFTSSAPPARPRLVAHPDIMGNASWNTPILATADPTPNNWEISHMTFDGNRFYRNNAWTCNGSYNPGGSNLIVKGSGFVIRYVESTQALCGSALEVNGSDYYIYDSVFTANGFADGQYYPFTFADGLTALRCEGGTIWNNYFVDNTDVDLIVGTGTYCTVRFNTVQHSNQFGFAGMQVGGNNANLSGSSISNNSVQAGYNLLSFGLVLGAHPWNGNHDTSHVGTVEDNAVSGAVMNVLVEGVYGGVFTGNSISGSQGNRGYAGCQIYGDYFVGAHVGSLTLQGGWIGITSFDTGICVP